MSDAATVIFNPFPGLRPFRIDEDYLFFGREEQTTELLTLLRKHRFLAVVGTSGSGKSSLVRAGLLPELQGGTMNVAGSEWEIVLLRPGGSPNWNLAQAIVEAGLYDEVDPETLPRVMATLQRSGMGLVETYRQSEADAKSNLLVVVDQFEELFRHQQTSMECRDQAVAFVNLLLEASRQQDCPIYVVLTMRSDYLGDCSQFRGLAEAVNRGEYLIPRLNRQQLQAAIEGPAKVGGGETSYRLLQHLLNDVGDDPDQLPLLQHALMRTWGYWVSDHEDGEPVDLRHYEAVGGMSEALTRHADEVLESLPDDHHRLVAERVFQTLTERGNDNRGIRRANRLSQLAKITASDEVVVATVVESYRRPGVTFLMPPSTQPLSSNTVVDLSHESLMRAWYRLRRWVDEEAQSARVYRRLAETAALWRDGKAGLYHDPDLQIAQTWRDERLPNEAWAAQYGGGFADAMAFLGESRAVADATLHAQEEARRRELEQAKRLAETRARAARNFKVFAGVLAVFGVLSLLMSVWAMRLRSIAELNRSDAESSKLSAEQASAQAFQDAESARLARLEAERLLVQSRHEQGAVWLERARALLNEDKHHLGAKLLAARAIGFDGFGRNNQPQSFRDAYPVLLKRQSPEWREVEQFIQLETEFPNVWRSPTSSLPSSARALCFTKDGRLMASCGGESVVRIWDTQSGDQVGVLKLEQPLGAMHSLCFAPDGNTLAISCGNAVRVWDVKRREQIAQLDHDALVYAVAYHPDGLRIAAGGNDRLVTVWEVESRQQVFQFNAHTNSIRALAFNPDGSRLASGDGGGRIRIWNLATGRQAGVLPDQDGAIRGLRYSPDGTLLASAGYNRKIQLWNAATRQLLREISLEQAVHSLDFNPDGTLLAAGGQSRKVHLIDSARMEEIAQLEGHTGNIRCLRFSHDGESIYSCALDSTIRAWSVADRSERLQRTGHLDEVSAVAFNPDGSVLASAAKDRTIRLWDMKTGQQLSQLEPGEAAQHLDFSGDGRFLLSCGAAGTLHLWDVASGEPWKQIRSRGAKQARFTPDGKHIFAACTDAEVRVWNVETGELEIGLPGHQGELRSLDISGDGKTVVSAGEDATVRIWDAEKRELLFQLDAQAPFYSVAINPQGTLVAAGAVDRTIQLWDILTRQPKRVLAAHETAVFCLRFSPNGDWLASGDANGEIRLWRPESGQQLALLLGHQGPVRSLAFAPDGRSIASGGDDHSVRVWEVVQSQLAETPHGPISQTSDGSQMVVGGANPLSLIDPDAERVVKTMLDAGEGFRAKPRISNDGKYVTALVLRQRTGEQRVWEVESGRQTATLPGLPYLTWTDFSPDGATLAVPISSSNLVRFLNPATGEMVDSLSTPFPPFACRYNRQGDKMVIVGGEGGMGIWDVASKRLLTRFGKGVATNHCVDFGFEEKTIAVGDVLGKVDLWDVASASRLATFDLEVEPTMDVKFSPDGRTLAAVGGSEGRALLWDLEQKKAIAVLEKSGPAGVLSCSTEGVLAVSGYQKTTFIDTSQRPVTNVDYSQYLKHYAFDGRKVDSVLHLNLYAEDRVPLAPRSASSHLATLRIEDETERNRELFRSFLRAKNYDSAAFVLNKLPAEEHVAQRQMFARALIGTASLLIDDKRLPQATRWLDLAEGFAPASAELWIARARVQQEQGKQEEALALIQRGIELASQAGDEGAQQVFRLALHRLRLRLSIADFAAAREDLEYLFSLPQLKSVEGQQRVVTEYLDARLEADAAEQASPEQARSALLSTAMLKGFLEARRQADVKLDELPEIRRLQSGAGTASGPPLHVKRNSVWKYYDKAEEVTGNWKEGQFDDRQWESGAAPFGFGDGREQTTLQKGMAAYYFRQRFEVDAGQLQPNASLYLNVVRDDGLIVYLNGKEVVRDNMPDGEVGPDAYALQAVNGPDETKTFTYRISSRQLIKGENVLAAEVHQTNATSSDVHFEMEMRLASAVSAPLAKIGVTENEQALKRCREILPDAVADAWTETLRFAFQNQVDPQRQDPQRQDPESWKARQRLQLAMGRRAESLLAMAHEYALLASLETESARSRRQELLAAQQKLLESLPRNSSNLEALSQAIEILSPAGAGGRPALLDLHQRRMRMVMAQGDLPLIRQALGEMLEPGLAVPAPLRNVNVLEYFDLAMKDDASRVGEDENARRRVLMAALLKTFEASLLRSDLDPASVAEWPLLMNATGDKKDVSTLVDAKASWRFDDRGSQPGPQWNQLDFDDAGWSVGSGPFGFGDNRQTTEFAKGHLAYYLRHKFDANLSDIAEDAGLVLQVARDDGLVVYLNGQEVLRDNMPTGQITDQSRAVSRIGDDAETQVHRFLMDGKNLLRNGPNLLAMELHQTGTTSSDLHLDLTLFLERKIAGFIVNLKKEQLEQAIQLSKDFLPEERAEAWIASLQFAFAPTVEDGRATSRTAVDWMARGRIQFALGRYQEAHQALLEELKVVDGKTTADAVSRRYAIELDMQKVLVRLGKSDQLAAWWADRVAKELSLLGAYRINCGGETLTGPDGVVWGADRGYETGGLTNAQSDIQGTENDALYQLRRWSYNPTNSLDTGLYSIPVPDGKYQLKLHFAEGSQQNIGTRVFDVYVEGAVVLPSYDIVAAVGNSTADVKTFVADVRDGRLDIGMLSHSGTPLISAIEISRAEKPAEPKPAGGD